MALLHVEVIEGDEQLLYPTSPAPELVDTFQRWCQFVARAGAWIQRPDVRSARCFFGLYDLESKQERKALLAAKCADILRKMVAVHFDRSGEQWLLRAGLVVRHFEATEGGAPAILEDNDADEAYWLAREAELPNGGSGPKCRLEAKDCSLNFLSGLFSDRLSHLAEIKISANQGLEFRLLS